MPQVTGVGTVWNLPNYAGELFTADATQTPLLSMTGGLTGGRQTANFEFPTAVMYDYPAPAQPAISETASITAPAPTEIARSQQSNVVQIFQEAIQLTYAKMSNMGRISGINSANDSPNPSDEKAWQISQRLIKIARDVEHTFINGQYQIATSAAVPNKTRGMLQLIAGGNEIDAANADLSKDLLNEMYLKMADAGAYFTNMVMFVPAVQKQKLSDIYLNSYKMALPTTRTIGGVNVEEIITDFFSFGIVWDRFMPQDTVLLADVAHISPVFQTVPGKGVLFEEPLAKTGASEAIQIYGQIGLAHGPAFLHGAITGLATA
jgi:hypothetical protein